MTFITTACYWKKSSSNRQPVFIAWKPWKSVEIKAVFSQAFHVQLIIIGYLFKLHSQVYTVFIGNIIHCKRKVSDLSWTHFIKMNTLFIKYQMKERNKIRKAGGRGEVRVILFCPFSTPSFFLGWLFTYVFCSCIKAFCVPLPWSLIWLSHMKDKKNGTELALT